ncbi:MAG: D-alanine--D-serine ligase VanG [Ruminococcus sp.]|jgi:D-alanine---D-serine ligase
MRKEPKNVGVLFGGCSTEYEISLQSAAAVISHLDTGKYMPVPIALDRQTGAWRWRRGEQEIPVFLSADRSLHGICWMEKGELHSLSLDAALPILHGKNGEDGTVQGALELAGIPIIGCDLLSSALCMDKEIAHRIVAAAGIRVPKSVLIQKESGEEEIKKAAGALSYPLFVKPVRSGSSFGITKVYDEGKLYSAVRKAFDYDTSVLLEETVPGFETGCAVLGCESLTVGELDEIELSEDFFDYTEKYSLKTSKIHVPARISPEKTKQLKETAVKIYRLLKCSYFARVDMFLTPDGEIYFNEVNTIPGFTVHSRYPNMMKAAGISFEQMLDKLLEMGLR